jgi:hypothetical protein
MFSGGPNGASLPDLEIGKADHTGRAAGCVWIIPARRSNGRQARRHLSYAEAIHVDVLSTQTRVIGYNPKKSHTSRANESGWQLCRFALSAR